MSITIALNRERMYEFFELTVKNDARPILILDDPDNISHEYFIDLFFSGRSDSIILSYQAFIMDYAYSLQKQKELERYTYVIVEHVEHLKGKSATSRILEDFAEHMKSFNTGVIFTGTSCIDDMSEFIESMGDDLQYVISVEHE